jgi:hypothetical protein
VDALAGAGKAASVNHRHEAAQKFEIHRGLWIGRTIQFSTGTHFII